MTQPLIEAAVRLSVARSTTPVQLTVRALEEEGNLLIEVEASGGDAPLPTQAEVDLALGRVDGRSSGGLSSGHAVRLQEARPGLLTIRLELPSTASSVWEQS
jgi:LytS/YehU family sensor histidine kinase